MVGDEDQSIYGFRAAYPEALLDFEKDHPGARVLLMEENFRSNAKIVSAADKFIQKNTLRHEKHMKAAREAGADIRKISLKSRKAQYVYLMKIAQECSTETAVLYRDNECNPSDRSAGAEAYSVSYAECRIVIFHAPHGSGYPEYHPVCDESERYRIVYADLLQIETFLPERRCFELYEHQ